jgi:microcystin-dependent protein
MATPGIAVPGTNVPSGSGVSPGGAQGIQGLQGVIGPQGDSAPIGAIMMWGSTTPPTNWMVADGSAISRATYPTLFSLIGTSFGAGDGSTTFNLPDLRSKVPVGSGQGASLSNRVLGAIGGEETHQLTLAELASHTHTASQGTHTHSVPALQGTASGGGYAVGQGGTGGIAWTIQGASAGAITIANAGNDNAHNNMQPYLVVCFVIKVSASAVITGTVIPIADSTQSGLLRKVSGKSTDFVDGTNNCQPLVGAFITKTAAYTLTIADSNKYVLCSGGSWTLTLPAPALGLVYELRNDMGISGTTGTITLQPTGGTIDGAATLALLPGQECKLRCDGTNWRTFNRQRIVVLGTLDITTPSASGVVLLPLGYRYFEVELMGTTPVTTGDYIVGQLSLNGGSTWVATGYYTGNFYNSSATAAAFSDIENGTSFYVSPQNVAANYVMGQSRLTIWPGTASTNASWQMDSGARNNSGYQFKWNGFGMLDGRGPVNAFKFYYSSGNIVAGSVTVKGIV